MRIRTIKPEFFLHEELFNAEYETQLPLRLAFAGLWCAADREGRFKWEPRRLGIQILPYDGADFSRVLDALSTRGFIVRYTSGTGVFGFIPSFAKHQVINNRERESEFPEPSQPIQNEDIDASGTRESHVEHAGKAEGKGREQGKEGNKEPSVPATHSPEGAVSAYSKPKPPRPPSTADPRHAEFVAIFAEEYHDATGQPYAMQGGKDGQQLQALLKTLKGLTAEEWRQGIQWAWKIANQDTFANACVRQTGSLAAFCAAWSRLVAYHATYQQPRR
jgi:hypothetical protein